VTDLGALIIYSSSLGKFFPYTALWSSPSACPNSF
jgi:hypothetical protein